MDGLLQYGIAGATLLSSPGGGWVALVVVALVLFIVTVVTVVMLSRRRFDRDCRGILDFIEELRAGEASRRVEVSGGSPLGVVADSVNRLGLDLHVRWSEADAAGERWRALSDAAQDTAILTTDTDGDVRSFSSGASRLFGWDEHEVLARPAALIFDESSYKDLLPKLARRSLRTQGITTRSRLLRRDGESFPAEVSVRMLSAPGGQPMGFMMVVRDVTEQTRLESDLRESEERFRGLVEGLAAAVFIVRGGRIVYANPAAGLVCGRAAQELEGALWRERVAARDVLVVEEVLAAVERKQAVRDELRCGLVGRGDAALDARIVISSIEFGGRPAALLLVHDETVDNRAAAELQSNEAKLDAVLEAASDGILVLTAERDGGVVQMVNQAFAELLGTNVDVLLGIGAARLLAMLRAAGDGMAVVADRITSPDSAERDVTVSPRPELSCEVRVQVSALRGRNGELLGRLVVCRDLTEQRRSEQRLQEQAEKLQLGKVELEQAYRQLSETHGQLQARTEELDRVNRELRRLDEMKSDLLGNVSHELQTPLVSIRGYTEMMLKERLGPITEEQRKGLGLSLKNIDRLISMIDNLLAFERTDPAEARLSLTRFKLRPLIQEAVDLLRAKMTAKEIDLSIEMHDEDAQIHGDRDRLLEVFLNLLSNAVKFNRRKGSVRITARAGSSGYSEVTLRDTGAGIPPESVGRIFDRHFRVRQEGADAADGSGLGLAIVRDILRLHGCTIQVESEEGRGSAFTFTLPLSGVPTAGAPEIEAPSLSAGESRTTAPPESEPDKRDEDATRPRLRIIRRFKTES